MRSRVLGADDRRNPEFARDDRRVAGAPAAIGDDGRGACFMIGSQSGVVMSVTSTSPGLKSPRSRRASRSPARRRCRCARPDGTSADQHLAGAAERELLDDVPSPSGKPPSPAAPARCTAADRCRPWPTRCPSAPDARPCRCNGARSSRRSRRVRARPHRLGRSARGRAGASGCCGRLARAAFDVDHLDLLAAERMAQYLPASLSRKVGLKTRNSSGSTAP